MTAGQPSHPAGAPTDTSVDPDRSNRRWAVIVGAAVIAASLLGVFEIANTSVGWHLASGRWILENRTFITADPFSFTSGQTPWVDHEWLFQVGAAVAHRIAGAPGLVILRALTVSILAVLLLVIGRRSGLAPPVALVVSIGCVAGASPRFFLRPELVTLVVVPLVCWLYLTREQRASMTWLAWLGGIIVIGANCHGGVLSVPFLLGGMLAGETAEMVVRRNWRWRVLASGGAAVVTATLALLVNPYGWRLYEVPFKLTHLIDQPHIPNPEWISPSFAQTPELYLALAAVVLLMALRERRAAPWVLLALATYLALRHIRNLGLFFVLVPLVASSALASWRIFANPGATSSRARSWIAAAAVALALVLAGATATSSGRVFGFNFAKGYFPVSACDFLDRVDLPRDELYNDVNFGGYLINRYAPGRLVFQDDRNEIHDELLRTIWSTLERSDVRGWTALLESYGCDAALVRYHAPIRTSPPDGQGAVLRGFSVKWFPQRDWALVYWDDVAMVFLRRHLAPPEVLTQHEYAIVRPDDLDQLHWRLDREPELRAQAIAEAHRARNAGPDNQRASMLATTLGRPAAEVTGP